MSDTACFSVGTYHLHIYSVSLLACDEAAVNENCTDHSPPCEPVILLLLPFGVRVALNTMDVMPGLCEIGFDMWFGFMDSCQSQWVDWSRSSSKLVSV